MAQQRRHHFKETIALSGLDLNWTGLYGRPTAKNADF